MNENNTDSIEIVSSYLDQYKASSESAKLKQLGQIVELITPTRSKQKHKLTHDELVAKVYSFDWTQMSGQFVDKVNAASLRRGYSTSTRHSLIIVCRGIAEKCWLARLIDRDEFERIKQTGKGMLSKKDRLKKLNKEVSVEDFQKLLAVCLSDEKPIRGLRDYALITMLYGTGLRASEAISVRLKNIDFGNGTITIKGKGDLTRTVYTVDGVMDAIKKWLSVHTPVKGVVFPAFAPQSDAPIQDRADRPMSYVALYEIIRHRALQAGITVPTPHSFRHTFASKTYDATHDIYAVQHQLGHRDQQTTMLYISQRSEDDAKKRAAKSWKLPD